MTISAPFMLLLAGLLQRTTVAATPSCTDLFVRQQFFEPRNIIYSVVLGTDRSEVLSTTQPFRAELQFSTPIQFDLTRVPQWVTMEEPLSLDEITIEMVNGGRGVNLYAPWQLPNATFAPGYLGNIPYFSLTYEGEVIHLTKAIVNDHLICQGVAMCGRRDGNVCDPASSVAAIYGRNSNGNLEFICGGFLVSSRRHIITSAHCVSQRQPEDLRVSLGKRKLNDEAEHVQNIGVSDRAEVEKVLLVNPNWATLRSVKWKAPNFAVLELAEEAQLTEHVHPACLHSAVAASLPENTPDLWGWVKDKQNDKSSEYHLEGVAAFCAYHDNCTAMRKFCRDNNEALSPCWSGGILGFFQSTKHPADELKTYLASVVAAPFLEDAENIQLVNSEAYELDQWIRDTVGPSTP